MAHLMVVEDPQAVLRDHVHERLGYASGDLSLVPGEELE